MAEGSMGSLMHHSVLGSRYHAIRKLARRIECADSLSVIWPRTIGSPRIFLPCAGTTPMRSKIFFLIAPLVALSKLG